MGRTIPGNGHPTIAWVYGPDAHAVMLANAMALGTNTFSPMAVGVHAAPDAGRRGYTGDPGYGVNRFAGELPYPLQNFGSPIAPIQHPKGRRLGIGAMTSGQPGLPSTGQDASGIAWLGLGQLNTGMGA